jgi:adenine phosphoribosyltransferase
LEAGFLFPYRMRTIGEDHLELKQDDLHLELKTVEFKKGDMAIINLLDSKLYFSLGPRSCVGRALVDRFFAKFLDILKPYHIVRIDENKIVRTPNQNIPEIVSKHVVELVIPKDSQKGLIQSFHHKGIEKFYRIESFTEDLSLYKYICCKMRDIIKSYGQIDYLIMSESRGFLFTPLTIMCDIPVIAVRKHGKISGPTFGESYQKAYDSKETIEMSVHSPIGGKRVIIIDDGIASGNTTLAIYNLITKNNGNVVAVVVGFCYDYVKSIYDKTAVHSIFFL